MLAGLARAAENAGAQIVEHAEVRALDFSNPLRLRVRRNVRGRIQQKEIRAEQVLLATNALSLELSGLRAAAEPKLTFALTTAPLSAAQLKAIGLSSRRPFYTIDLPYLWGRLLESNSVIFGSGLVPAYAGPPSNFPLGDRSIKSAVMFAAAKPPPASAGSKAASDIYTLPLPTCASPTAGAARFSSPKKCAPSSAGLPRRSIPAANK